MKLILLNRRHLRRGKVLFTPSFEKRINDFDFPSSKFRMEKELLFSTILQHILISLVSDLVCTFGKYFPKVNTNERSMNIKFVHFWKIFSKSERFRFQSDEKIRNLNSFLLVRIRYIFELAEQHYTTIHLLKAALLLKRDGPCPSSSICSGQRTPL